MKIGGIICEYNPFHNGHAHHIEETKKVCDGVVCVMSGDFVQRGEPAIISKHLRAEMAVKNGADLVIELPVPYSCASAERFAKGGVGILSSLCVVDTISFGAECEDIDILKKCAEILNESGFYNAVAEELKSGCSFPVARENVLRKIHPLCADAIAKPNNLLAVEYLRALPVGMDAMAVKRIGCEHDGAATDGNFASASFIRENLDSDLSAFMPESAYEILKGTQAVALDDKIILSYLKRLSAEELKNVPDVTEGLEGRLVKAIAAANSLDRLYTAVKTKRYPLSRIRRIILNAYLGITKDEVNEPPAFARILAMNDKGKKILAAARKVSKIPLITKPADGKGIPAFEKSVLCSDLYAMFSRDKQISEWKRSPYIEKEEQR